MTDTPFYIDKLPENATYCMRREFRDMYGRDYLGQRRLMNEIQMIEPRLSKQEFDEIYRHPIPDEFVDYFAIKDTKPSITGGKEAVCGLLLYNPHFRMTNQPEDKYLKQHQIYLDGLAVAIEYYKTELPQQTLRVYVGDNCWDTIHDLGHLKAKHVEFVRMEHDSYKTYLGSIWRFLVIDDDDYEYAYAMDTDETWEERMHMSRSQLDFRLKAGADSEAHCAASITAFPMQDHYVREPSLADVKLFFDGDVPMRDSSLLARPSNYVLLNACTFTRGPKSRPFKSIIPFLCWNLKRNDDVILYHPPSNQYTTFLRISHHHDYNQMDEHWLFPLMKILTVKGWVPRDSSDHRLDVMTRFKNWYGDDFWLYRLYCQMAREGHSFVIEREEEKGFIWDCL